MKDQRNRRRHPRLKIDIPVVIEYQSQVYDDCRMLNYSRGGVYLQCLNEKLDKVFSHGYIAEPDRQDALISIPDNSKQVAIKVVYFDNGGLGASFSDDDGDRLYKLLSKQTSAADTQRETGQRAYEPDQSRKTLSQIAITTKPLLEGCLVSFFSQAQLELQQRISETSDPQEQSGLFFALNSLEKDHATITEQFIQQTEMSFSELTGASTSKPTPESNLSDEMALVETQEIEIWILVNDMARQVESEVSRQLYHIDAALSHLCQDNIHNELNPIAPISLLSTFKKVLDAYQFDTQITRLILGSFSKSLINTLNKLYEKLLQQMRQQKIVGEPESQPQWTIIKTAETSNIANTPIGHLSDLHHLHHIDDSQTATQGMSADEQKEILTSLSSLSQQQTASLQQQIENLLQQESTKPIQLSNEARAAIGAGEELVATLSEDPLISNELRSLMGNLKFQIIEAILKDTNLLENPDHPVRHLLDSIESMKPYVNKGSRNSILRDRESQQLSVISEAVENGHYNHIDEVTQELARLLKEQHERFETNRKLSISRCLKDEKLRQAQTTTYDALAKLLLNQTISPIVDKLFRFGWVNLMVQTAVLEKSGNQGWQSYLQIVEQLHQIFTDPPGEHHLSELQQKSLLSTIHKGFTDYPIYAEEAHGFELELQRLLESGVEGDNFPHLRIEVNKAYLHHYFQGMHIRQEPVDNTAEDQQWQKQLNAIALDTWLVDQENTDQPRILSLAWKNPQSGRYLLVDGDGFKALDETLQQLANRFARQQIHPMAASAKPVVERTIETILSNTYNDFKQESDIDRLTGLSNRRAFESELNKHINGQQQECAGVLLQIDLDKFQVVNDLCGFEGGDKLLQTVTDILLSYLPDEGLLGRIGDDEFSLLLSGQNLESGYQSAEMLRQAIDETAFRWKGRLIPSTASIGIVQIEANTQRTDKLMQAALAACNTAKRGGGNCTRIYLESDPVYQERQQLVESLPKIKEALAKGRMELFVQPIVPLQKSNTLPHHHEILLRILNDEGELESPVAFIQAAETYDLMRDVDFWVVEAFFQQVEPYADRLPEGHSFSINLSGKSLGDGDFKAQLIDRIKSSSLQTGHFGFEITETALVGDISDTANTINEIRALGCSFSLDDFGSGYASFSYLKDFPVDYVKIDGIFVREILNKPADYAMISSITEIAHFMEKMVIAEFVSDENTSQALTHMGVDYGQGYHFGKPRPLKEMLTEIIGTNE
ncbi:MAG: DUF1631 family protein [Candidatus Thiodiazotropha sp. DIVDIV]